MLQYVLLISSILLPGIFIVLATNLHQGKSFSEFIALCFGVGVSIFTLFVALTTLLLDKLQTTYFIPFLLITLAGSISLSFVRRTKITVEISDLYVFLLAVSQFAILSSTFLKYPIFPPTSSHDFLFHISTAQQMVKQGIELSAIDYPPMIHWFLGGEIILVGGNPIVASRVTMALLASLVPFLVYAAGVRLSNRRFALISATVYTFISPIWYQMLFVSGTYANFLGNALTLTTLFLLIEVYEIARPAPATILLISSTTLLLSHFTPTVFVIAAWLMIPILRDGTESPRKSCLRAALILTVPAFAALILRPDIIGILINVPQLTQGIVAASQDSLTNSLMSVSPFLGFFDMVGGHVAFLLLAIGAPFTLWRTRKNIRRWRLFPYLWFLLPWLLSPSAPLASRFSVYALLPATFILGDILMNIMPKLISSKGRTFICTRRSLGATTAVSIILTALAFGSPVIGTVNDVASETETVSFQQLLILDSMNWLAANTEPETKVASIGLWEYMYMPTLTDRTFAGDWLLEPEDMKSVIVAEQIDSIVVSNTVEVANAYESHPDFEKAFRNDLITIYCVNDGKAV